MRTYRGLGPRSESTPQSEPIPGSNQVPNNAGGFTWAIDDWARLERFLILGSEGGTYYVNERKLTQDNAACVARCIQADGLRTVKTIVEISEAGRAPKNDPALLALAMCASPPANEYVRAAALGALPRVARTGTHLLHFLAFAKQFRGWGKGMRKAVGVWFNDRKPVDLAYQVTKYPSRDKWALSDALRLAHVKPASPDHSALYKWVVDGEMMFERHSPEVDNYMRARAELSHSQPKHAAQLIADFRLPREVVPTELLTSPEVWAALLQHMPMTAMIRNLATMTRVGLLKLLSDETRLVMETLRNEERIRKARVHPIQVLSALLTYKAGHGNRGQNIWTPVQSICDALDDAFYLAFGNVQPSNARTLLALDVSGSMQSGTVGGVMGLTPILAEGAMAMVTARTEPQHGFVAFSAGMGGRRSTLDPGITPMDLSPKMRLDDVVKHMFTYPMAGTDCSLPMKWARENKIMVDTFVIYTDNETWAGRSHPSQELRKYREATGIQSKCIVVGMTATECSIADPNDAGMLDVAGFDTATPQVIGNFARPVNAAFEPAVWQGESDDID